MNALVRQRVASIPGLDFVSSLQWARFRENHTRDSFYRGLDGDKIACPINVDDAHWCCAYIDFTAREIKCYDPYQNARPAHAATAANVAAHVLRCRGESTDLSSWTVDENAAGPMQVDNDIDCGVFVTCYLMCEAMGINHHRVFRQEDMPFIRDRLAYELLMATES